MEYKFKIFQGSDLTKIEKEVNAWMDRQSRFTTIEATTLQHLGGLYVFTILYRR